jgi:integrase
MLLAENIRAKRLLDEQSTSHGFISRVKSKTCFIAYFKTLVDKKYDSIGNHGNWASCYRHLVNFNNGKELPLERVDETFLELFKEYLLSCNSVKNKVMVKLNRNTAVSYFNKVRAALREAYNNKMIKENPSPRVKCIKGQDTHREFLTLEELQKLASTPSKDPLQKKLFLTSALCGLRFSDLKNLKWGNIKYTENDGYYIQYTQKKTKKAEILPIAEHVVNMLGKKGESTELIFYGIKYSDRQNTKLKDWIKSAGIDKKITIHNARHSYACLQISLGTDLYTVSKLLGHSSLKTTQIYAKVMDLQKIDAAKRIPMLSCF